MFMPSLVKIDQGKVTKMMHGIPDKRLAFTALSIPLGGTTASILPKIQGLFFLTHHPLIIIIITPTISNAP